MSSSTSSLTPKMSMPEFYDFKPFFTLQPVSETREKQLRCWCSIITNYCTSNNVYTVDPTRFPLFRNILLGRQLSVEGIQAVIHKLMDSGNAEWEDASHTRLRIILKSAESLAADIYAWVCENEYISNVFTLYELHSGDDYQDSGFSLTDPIIIRRALAVLEREKKCTIFEGSNPGEEGVKFMTV